MERELSGALPLVKAEEVHKVLRPAVEDVLQARGFARTAGTPHDLSPQRRGWWVAITGYHFAVVDLQLNPRGFSRHWGSRFTLNFELSPRPTPIGSDYLRARLWKLLERGHRKRALEIQRKVVASLPEPPELIRRNFHGAHFAPPRYWPWEDVWLRYSTLDDVRVWADFLRQSLPSATDRFVDSARKKIGRKRN